MASIYTANDPVVYEQSMGRWSRRLARAFIPFARLGDRKTVLDVGCGTGSLTFALAQTVPEGTIRGLDYSQAFVDHASAQAAGEPRLKFEQGDAAALPYPDGQFDAALSLLCLNFVPDALKAAREMVRVTRQDGLVAASVWDFRGGLTFLRMFADTAAPLDEGAVAFRVRQFSAPFTQAGELEAAWTQMGLREVEQTALAIRMEFSSFADYWGPWLGGQGPVGAYVTGLSDEKRATIAHHVRLAYLAGGEDGPRSFAATAWAVRGLKA